MATLIASGERKHVVVLGAGPAGLTATYELLKHDVLVTVVEKDPLQVGGLARTVEHRGYRFDIGGHRFFSKNEEVEALWTEILGDEMLTRGRLSRIYYRGRFFAYPIKAANALWNLGPVEAVRFAPLQHLLQDLHGKGVGHQHERALRGLGGATDQEP